MDELGISGRGEMRGPRLTPEQAARVHRVLEKLHRERFQGSVTDLARALHLSQPALSNLLHQRHRPALKTAENVARLSGVPLEELLGLVEADPCPARALALGRLRGLLSPEVVDAVRAIVLPPGVDQDELDWIADALAEHRLRAKGKSKPSSGAS
jgi:transcriptional regulator with XRE-family HTH domain